MAGFRKSGAEEKVQVVIRWAERWATRRRRRLAGAAARLKRQAQAGSAAVEFAFVAPIFFIFLMGTLEIGIIFLGEFSLQNATNDAARLIRTGQVALNSMTAAQFRTYICNEVDPLLSCDANLQIDVETYSSFSAASFGSPLKADGTLDPTLNNFSPGTVCSIVMVRTFYVWDVVTPLLTPLLANMANNDHLLTATAAFRNEPYTTGVSGC